MKAAIHIRNLSDRGIKLEDLIIFAKHENEIDAMIISMPEYNVITDCDFFVTPKKKLSIMRFCMWYMRRKAEKNLSRKDGKKQYNADGSLMSTNFDG